MVELWRTIEEYPLYEVSTLGRIRNKKRKNILKPGNDRGGYEIVCLEIKCWKESGKWLRKRKTQKVHRLVAKTFLEDSSCYGLDVNHINCDRKDNRVENLEWCTRKQNIHHGMKEGDFNQKGSANNLSKLTEKDVVEIRSRKESNRKIADEFGVCIRSIQKIKRRVTWKHI